MSALENARAEQGSVGLVSDFHVYCDGCMFMTSGYATKEQAGEALERHINTRSHRWRNGEPVTDFITFREPEGD